MSFFDKMKQGASEAAKKAQQTVEITRIKASIFAKQKEIERQYQLIGQQVYQAYSSGNLSHAETAVASGAEAIKLIEQEIKLLEHKIVEVKKEKECVCGKVVLADTKYCPVCGYKFPNEPVIIDLENPSREP